MIRDPEKMTSVEIRRMQRNLAARVTDAENRMLIIRDHDRAVAELRRLLALQREIEEWE